MNHLKLFIAVPFFISCAATKKIHWPQRSSAMTGNEFYHHAFAMKWKERDSFVVKQILAGDAPRFLEKFVAIHVSIMDSTQQKTIKATYYVAPDYLSVGTDRDWSRINITPLAAQKIADTFNCFLPTKKIVDDIYRAAKVKLEPVPMYAFRDSTPTMWHHHLIVEGQRKGRKGLVAGIQKDVVISEKLSKDTSDDHVAIYGWHKLDGNPIQPLYTGHVYWWVDYSQCVRLIYRKIKIGRKWMDYTEVLNDPALQRLLCDEERCDFFRYRYRN
ncbi:MAG TPA: hypothetical protein VFP87_06825 [Chitinophagaceae bacterium]|nr:hypothetical protein [Chitinophagaceae bacterium]